MRRSNRASYIHENITHNPPLTHRFHGNGGDILVISTAGTTELGGFIIADENASGRVSLMGGCLVVTSHYGAAFQTLNGCGIGVLTPGQGGEVFMQTDSKRITFGQGTGAASCIDFQTDSHGQLSLHEATEEAYVAGVNVGKIRLNGSPTSPDKFRFINLPPQGIYTLDTP